VKWVGSGILYEDEKLLKKTNTSTDYVACAEHERNVLYQREKCMWHFDGCCPKYEA
jgi:protease II